MSPGDNDSTASGSRIRPAGAGESNETAPPTLVTRLSQSIRNVFRRLDFALARRFALTTREERLFFLLIPTIGVVAGLLGIAVHRAIDGVRVLLWGYWPSFVSI